MCMCTELSRDSSRGVDGVGVGVGGAGLTVDAEGLQTARQAGGGIGCPCPGLLRHGGHEAALRQGPHWRCPPQFMYLTCSFENCATPALCTLGWLDWECLQAAALSRWVTSIIEARWVPCQQCTGVSLCQECRLLVITTLQASITIGGSLVESLQPLKLQNARPPKQPRGPDTEPEWRPIGEPVRAALHGSRHPAQPAAGGPPRAAAADLLRRRRRCRCARPWAGTAALLLSVPTDTWENCSIYQTLTASLAAATLCLRRLQPCCPAGRSPAETASSPLPCKSW